MIASSVQQTADFAARYAKTLRPGGALESLRLSEDGIGAIRLGSKVFFNETEPRAFWQVTLTFDLVVRVKP